MSFAGPGVKRKRASLQTDSPVAHARGKSVGAIIFVFLKDLPCAAS
jgi:hypothetical protein